ncbi:hypothetical protein AB6A40_003921 [Gnathostoma spinigerum]|uniref:Uncharacterized protein n=1 Tax=Gnathostoma spinigerum TaxID=75299 RepID=A0ABD6EKW3_9BILA
MITSVDSPMLITCLVYSATIILTTFAGIQNVYTLQNYYADNDFDNGLPEGTAILTPIKGQASFFNNSQPGFKTGYVSGFISFYQANYPNNQAVVIKIVLCFPKSPQPHLYRIDVLFAGDTSERYCQQAHTMKALCVLNVSAGATFYQQSFHQYDISVIDEPNSIIGRTIRLICMDCQSEAMIAGCAVIGRTADDAYVEKDRSLDWNLRSEYPRGSFLSIHNPASSDPSQWYLISR